MIGKFLLGLIIGIAIMLWYAYSDALTVYVCRGGASPTFQDVPCGKEVPIPPPRDLPAVWGDPVVLQAYRSFNGDWVYVQRQDGPFGSHRVQTFSNGSMTREVEWK